MDFLFVDCRTHSENPAHIHACQAADSMLKFFVGWHSCNILLFCFIWCNKALIKYLSIGNRVAECVSVGESTRLVIATCVKCIVTYRKCSTSLSVALSRSLPTQYSSNAELTVCARFSKFGLFTRRQSGARAGRKPIWMFKMPSDLLLRLIINCISVFVHDERTNTMTNRTQNNRIIILHARAFVAGVEFDCSHYWLRTENILLRICRRRWF